MREETDLRDIQRVDLSQVSSVYGPVRSWRVGMSLGVDPICVNSVCSFDCTYCQLGAIQVRTNRRRVFVPTAKIVEDVRASRWREADIVTVTGSGEPTLASNLGEIIHETKGLVDKPLLVLTNGALLHLPEVREELREADRVFVKLDAATDETFRRINRPVEGVTLSGIVRAVSEFKDHYPGRLGIQVMFTQANLKDADRLAELVNRIQPHEVQLNTPTRPYPRQWVLQTRGSHDGVDYPATPLKPISRQQAREVERTLRELTNLSIVSVYGAEE